MTGPHRGVDQAAEAGHLSTAEAALPPALACDGLCHQFGERRAVDGVSLRIEAGEIFGLLGPNGAGKTTTIRLITTLLPLQHGRVRVFGVDAARQPLLVRRLLGYVPQQLSADGALTGRQNVALFARLFDVPRRERRLRVEEALAVVDLGDAADRLGSTYSGGMVRRLELAQALVSRPRLLVLDEPTIGLDPIGRAAVWEHLTRLRAEAGLTVLVTTHYMDEADTWCDRVALMHRGLLRATGSPADLRAALGPAATLDDVFRHHTGDRLDAGAPDGEEGGLRAVRTARSTARRLG